MRTAIIAIIVSALLSFGPSPAFAQIAGDQVTCTGKVFNSDVKPPNRMSYGDRNVVHTAQVWDQAGRYRCLIDRDGAADPSRRWPCETGDKCRVVGTLAFRSSSHTVLILRHGKPVDEQTYVILEFVSAEKFNSPRPGPGGFRRRARSYSAEMSWPV